MSTDTSRGARSRTAEPTVPYELAGTGCVGNVTAGTRYGDDAVAGTGRPRWWRRMWRRLMPSADAELVMGQLDRQLAVLEAARTELEAGWVQGGWWAISSKDGSTRLATGYATAGGNPDQVDGACLVGAIVRAGSRLLFAGPDAARSDIGRAVDAVYDALWTSRGQPDVRLPGRLAPVPPPDVRLARVRTLTQWNDQAGRSRAEVLEVVDRAISATITDLVSVSRCRGTRLLPACPVSGDGGPPAPTPRPA